GLAGRRRGGSNAGLGIYWQELGDPQRRGARPGHGGSVAKRWLDRRRSIMRSKFGFLIMALACVFAASLSVRAEGPPAWAYGFNTPAGAGAPAAAPAPPTPDTTPRHVPGSDKVFVRQQIANQYGPADWFPGDHGPMPDIVAHGRQESMIAACSLC